MLCSLSVLCLKMRKDARTALRRGPNLGPQDDNMDVLLVDLLAHVIVHLGKSTRKRDRWGPIGQVACVSCVKDKQSCHTLCDHVRSGIIVVRFQKGLVANLSAERQLSVAKLSTKRIFSLAKCDFLVANGRMAADFSSPGCVPPKKSFLAVHNTPLFGPWLFILQ